MTSHAPLFRALEEAAGAAAVRTDEAALFLGAADLYEMGPKPVAVIRPDSPEAVARAVGAATSRDYVVVPRGGGLSYTGGYQCTAERTVLFDLAGLDRIVAISEQDMIVTAEAGVTWKQLHDALKPRGLRLPYFGTFSGAGATIGGGLSHGALFFGSARYGSAAENALAIEVATANGALLGTGQWALGKDAKPVFRGFGPDTTGLFLHDGGALGIKTRATFRLIRTPAATGYASFAFAKIEDAARALSEVARAGIAEDAYVLDPAAVATASERKRGFGAAVAAISKLTRSAGVGRQLTHALIDLARGGPSVIPPGAFSLHCVAAGSSRAAVAADLKAARAMVHRNGGRPIAATIPRLARADPFPDLNAVLGQGGARWAALNAKVAHSEGVALIDAHRRLIGAHEREMITRGVSVTYLLSALGTHSFSVEAVFHWRDAWLPIHRDKVDPGLLASYVEPQANPDARALVGTLRAETVRLFGDFGAASNQIGRTYPYVDVLAPEPAALVRGLKALLDPNGLMNPGVLGF